MALPDFDRNGEATIVAAEGRAALTAGDTVRAREKYDAAGKLIERSVAGVWKQSEKHFLRFLAASQYYHGGNYRKAQELCQRIEGRLLPPEVRGLYPQFLRDVRIRSAADYQDRSRQQLVGMGLKDQPQKIIEMLQSHPYVLPADALAYARAFACEELKRYEAAAAFYSDALRRTSHAMIIRESAAGIPLQLLTEGNVDEAWVYVQHQIKYMPHPITYVTAALVFFHRAAEAAGESRQEMYRAVIEYFQKAQLGFRELANEQGDHPTLRSWMALGYKAAAHALAELGDSVQSREYWNQAEMLAELRPETFHPRESNGMEAAPLLHSREEQLRKAFERTKNRVQRPLEHVNN